MANQDIPFADFKQIYPTENDIAFAPYNGVNGSEVNYSKNLHWRNPKNCILAELDGFGNPTSKGGFEPATGSGLTINLIRQGGRAYIEGRFIELVTGADYNITCDADKDTYVYLALNISGTVQVSPPARFKTVAVAHGATHAREPNAVLICKVVTDATLVKFFYDLRPSQISESANFWSANTKFAGEDGSAGIAIPVIPIDFSLVGAYAGFIPIGILNIDDVFFTKTLCGYFNAISNADNAVATITMRARGADLLVEGDNYVDNTQISFASVASPIQLRNTLREWHIARGFVNIPSSLTPIGRDYSFYGIYYKASITSPAGGTNYLPLNMFKLKEWNATA